jgi:hypothetical protein
MGLSRVLALICTLILQNTLVNAQSTGVTTLDATACASPSCTVTPTAISDITIQPTPFTIQAPGALTPVVIEFDAITITSLQPSPTVLHNPGSGVLTLGKTTVSNLKVTATTSYFVSPTETLDVAAVADVRGETQLFFGFNNDGQSACELFGITDASSDASVLNSRIVGKSLAKRAVVPKQFGNPGSNEMTWLNNGISEALIVLRAVLTRLNSVPDVTQLADLGWVGNSLRSLTSIK